MGVDYRFNKLNQSQKATAVQKEQQELLEMDQQENQVESLNKDLIQSLDHITERIIQQFHNYQEKFEKIKKDHQEQKILLKMIILSNQRFGFKRNLKKNINQELQLEKIQGKQSVNEEDFGNHIVFKTLILQQNRVVVYKVHYLPEFIGFPRTKKFSNRQKIFKNISIQVQLKTSTNQYILLRVFRMLNYVNNQSRLLMINKNYKQWLIIEFDSCKNGADLYTNFIQQLIKMLFVSKLTTINQ